MIGMHTCAGHARPMAGYSTHQLEHLTRARDFFQLGGDLTIPGWRSARTGGAGWRVWGASTTAIVLPLIEAHVPGHDSAPYMYHAYRMALGMGGRAGAGPQPQSQSQARALKSLRKRMEAQPQPQVCAKCGGGLTVLVAERYCKACGFDFRGQSRARGAGHPLSSGPAAVHSDGQRRARRRLGRGAALPASSKSSSSDAAPTLRSGSAAAESVGVRAPPAVPGGDTAGSLRGFWGDFLPQHKLLS
eukprot:gene4178-biopygen6598